MSDSGATLFHGRLRDASGRLLWLGLAMVVLGLAAVAFPMISTLVAALLVGWSLLLSGIVLLIASFSIHGTGPFFGALLSSLISVAAGAFLLFNPLAGAVALTLLVGVIFLVQGAFELYFAFEMRPHAGWQGMLLSGLASIVMAVLIAAGWPAVSAIVLGILLGVNFLSTGIGYIVVSRSLKAV
ncbi:MAG: HdeD family acid-resistance protein [Rhizomicrobium sp.]